MKPALTGSVTRQPFGTLPDGNPVELYTVNGGGVTLKAITLGGIITSLRVPDRDGCVENVVLGHETLAPYLHNPHYLGAIVGRSANRIAFGRFSLDGTAYQLHTNDGPHHLHGGRVGFDRHLWAAAPIQRTDSTGVSFSRLSASGEERYPGALRVTVTYTVSSEGIVRLEYEATTDAATIVNLTQHSYFNLGGGGRPNVLAHHLTIEADAYTPIAEGLIPIGVVAPVRGTPFDFRRGGEVGERLSENDDQLRRGAGFDHNLVLSRTSEVLEPLAELRDPASGRTLRIATTEPGVQLYTGQLLGSQADDVFGPHAGLCLETQHYPDAPNRPEFPSTILRPGETYQSVTTWQFSAG